MSPPLLRFIALILLAWTGETQRCAASTPTPTARFPVSSESKLVLSGAVEKGTVIDGKLPDSLQAPAGTYLAVTETVEGVFFAAPENMYSGKFGDLKPTDGGIFMPKALSPKNQAYLYTGSPHAPKLKEMFWRDLYVIEGIVWHIEPSEGKIATAPANWLAGITKWAESLDGGKWRLKEHGEPVMRWSNPSGYLVTVVLAPASGTIGKDDDFPQSVYGLLIADEAVSWSLLRLNITKTGRFITQLPPEQFVWQKVRPKLPLPKP